MAKIIRNIFFTLGFFITFTSSYGQSPVDSAHLNQILEVTTRYINRNIKDSANFEGVLELERIYENIANTNDKAIASRHLGIYYRSIFAMDESAFYLLKGLELAKKTENWGLVLELYKELATVYRNKNELDKLKNSIDTSLAIVKTHNLKSKILIPLMELTLYYSYDTYQYEKGIEAGELFLKEANFYNNQNISEDTMFAYRYETETVIIKMELAKCYIYLDKEPEVALAYLQEAADFFGPFNDNEKLYRINEQYVNYYVKVGDKEKAQEYISKLNYQRKIHDLNVLRRTNEVPKFIFESAELERDLAFTKLENEKLVFESSVFLGFLLLMFISGTIFYFSFMKNKRIQKELNHSLLVQNELLETVNKEKSKFFSILSHELRTPIYAITGLTSIMNDQNIDRQQIKAIRHSGNYLLFLINNILKFTNFEHPGMDVQVKSIPFDLTNVLEGIVQSSRYFAAQHNIQIRLDIPWYADNWVKGDSQKLTQVLLNLIVNSIKYSQDREVVLSVEVMDQSKKSENVIFKVIDNGVGISKEKQAKMFQFMERGDKDSTSENQFNLHGVGIGLFVVDKLVKEMGSKIKVESDINKGTTFSFVLDLEKTEPIILAQTVDKISSAVTGNVLVVDDNKINLMVAKKMVEKLAFKCYTATDADDVISIILKKDIQLVLMDLNMPQINGYELSKKIKRKINIPIIAHTAVIEEELDIDLLKESGIRNYIIKPYTEEALKKTLINGFALSEVNA